MYSLQRRFILYCAIGILFLPIAGCVKESEPDCQGNTATLAVTTSHPCIAGGTITVSAPTGAAFQYRIDNSALQSSPVFGNLLPGKYRITVFENNKCTSSAEGEVGVIPSGPLFASVKSLFAVNCTPCHTGNNPQAGLDLTQNCSIVSNWDKIRIRAVDGNPSPMPQSGLLPLSERNKITNWINAGHRYTD
jgi:hypothetical protein